MALVLKDRVKETTSTTGTGSLTLGGAVTGYQSFSSAIGNTNTTYYAIYLDGGSEWEVGIGTVSAGALSRDTVLASSNSGSLVNFSAGQKTVWCDYPAGKAVYLDASGNISGLAGSISTASYIAFNTSYSTTLSAGQLGWDGNDSLGLGMSGGNVIQHIGEDQFFYTKASSAITKGQVVMFTGAVGASGVPTGAPATGITDGTYIMGIAAESIALNGFGLVQTFGTIRNVNTSTYADGDILWYDPSVTGGLTKTKPTAPNVKVQMAAVINGGSSGGGSILIRINPGSTLGGTDSNAQITSPSNGQILTYDGTNTYWKNTTLTAGTGITTTPSSTGVITVTNTAPDQTVALTGGTGISVTGTYPNFTVTNTSPSSGGTVTSVTGTAPISSSGGNTPAISISQATTSTNGYLSSTDWNTFNNKQPAGSYLTTVTASTPLSGSGTSGSPLVIAQANTTTSGYLTSTDWNTFNNKQAALVSGTNIKTVNSTSLLGSGDVSVGVLTVTGTSPVVSSGGANPAISMPAATGSVNGYLTSTDWTTFNNKGSGTVTSVGITAGTGISVSGSPITSSGSITVTNSSPMTYPSGTGIAVVTSGTSWGTTLTAPSGTIVGTTDTQTLTNKRVTPRVSTTTSSATPTINTDNVDVYGLTAQAADITSFTTNLSGTPTDGQKLWIYIVGTAARAITWGTSFEASTQPLPTTTVSTNRLDIGFVWNAATSKWRCMAVA